ncbi:MAG: opioid growth factor receptor-related protein [Nostoc sp.]|uniref:opioid growth factor receptor-related protein n=1 Tax=Nostoc sp. TaxID=1180 RepID=UPI002FF51291
MQEMWTWDFEKLECAHDYIQWLFPLPERSAFNCDAPIVDEEVIQAFQSNPHLRQNLLRSFRVMLQFYDRFM